MPSPAGFITAFFATVMGFSLIWQIWWLAILNFVAAVLVVLIGTRNPNNARSCDRPENPASGAANGTISCGGFDPERTDRGRSQFRARSSSGGIRGSGCAHEHQPYVECWTRGYVQYWIRKICRADPHLGGARQAGSL